MARANRASQGSQRACSHARTHRQQVGATTFVVCNACDQLITGYATATRAQR